MGYLQSGTDITVNGPLSVENLQVDVETGRYETLSITSGINIDNGTLTLTDSEKSAISVKNVEHNYTYKGKLSDTDISRSNVFGINLNNVSLSGISSLSAENIKSNTVYNEYEGDKIHHGSIIGLNLSNLKSTQTINLSASNIESTLSYTDVTTSTFCTPTYGISLTGKDSQLKIGEIKAENIIGDISKLKGVYLQDLNEDKTTIDNLYVSNISQNSSSRVDTSSSVDGLHIEAGSSDGVSSDIKINNEIKISGINTKNTGTSQRVSGLFIGTEADRDFENSLHGDANLTAHKITIENIHSSGSGSISGLMVNVKEAYKNPDKKVTINADILNVNNISSSNVTSKTPSSDHGTFGLNLVNSAIDINNISVEEITSSGKDYNAYGIKLNLQSSINSSNIIINNIKSDEKSYGLVAVYQDTNLTTNTLQISNIQGNEAYGLKLGEKSTATESDRSNFTINESTYIDVADGYALSSSCTNINFNGTQAILSGDVQFDTGSLQINAATASIDGNVIVGNAGKFSASAISKTRSSKDPLVIQNLRGTDSNNHPTFNEIPDAPEYSSWEWSKRLDALTVGDGETLWKDLNGESVISDEDYALIDLDRSVTIAVQDDTQYRATSKTEQEITFGAAIRVNSEGRVLLDDASSDYTVLGDIIAGNGSLMLGFPEPYYQEEIESKLQQGYQLQGGEISLGGRKLTIVGDIFAGNGGKVTLTMNGTSSFEGQVDDYHELNNIKSGQVFHNSAFLGYEKQYETPVYTAGNVSITMNDEATWTARGQSFLSSLSFGDNFSGLVDLSKDEASSITVANLSGNGRFKLHLNSSDVTKSDMLYVTDSMSGSHEIIINGDVNVNEISEDNPLRFATVKTNSPSAATFKARSVDLGFFNNQYTIAAESFKQGDEDNVAYNGEDDGKGAYKPGNNMVEAVFDENDSNIIITGVAKRTESDAGRTVINMSRANYANAVYMDTLNKRMGEARYAMGHDNGIWVRMRHDNIGKDDSFRSHNTMVEVGYDFRQALDESEFRYGAVLDYMNGQNEYHAVSGDGDLQRYGAWIYGTWLADDGQYADLVLKYGHLKNDFDVFAPYAGEHITGDYSNDVISASAEYGWKFANAAGWYVEPQAQLQYSYVTSADYTTSQGTKIDLDSIDSLIGRVGFRAGKDFAAENPITAYIRGDVLHEFLGDQDISARDTTGVFNETFENDDTWYSVGVGLSVMTTANTYFFIEGEQVFGADNEDTYSISGGFKHSF